MFAIAIVLASPEAGPADALPDHYGVFAATDVGLVQLNGQRVRSKGNILQAHIGIDGASGQGLGRVSHLVVFLRGVSPNRLQLSRLELRKDGQVNNAIGKTHVELNLWMPAKDIRLDVGPVAGRQDMYRLRPRGSLSAGFYAVHSGELGLHSSVDAAAGGVVYDFVIGDASGFQSYVTLLKKEQLKVNAEAQRLLKLMNESFNSHHYAAIRQTYRPSGQVLDAARWGAYEQGVDLWYRTAGRIGGCRVLNASVMADRAILQLETDYEKLGKQLESLTVAKIDGKYYVTSLD
jgi:hypothetical protein